MALSFTGVNTGNKYEAGQTYKMGGDSYVAQMDGSFVNQQTGRSFQGSSNPSYGQEVNWSYDGPSYSSGYAFAHSDRDYVNQLMTTVRDQEKSIASSQGYAASSAPASAGVVAPSRGAGLSSSRAASFADAARGSRASGWAQPGKALWDEYKDGPSVIPNSLFYQQASHADHKGRPLPFGGFNWEMNPNWPNAEKIEEEMGEGEFLSPAWAMEWGIAAASVLWNGSRLADHTLSGTNDAVNSVANPVHRAGLIATDYIAGTGLRQPNFGGGLSAPEFPVNDNYDDILRRYKQAGIAANGPL